MGSKSYFYLLLLCWLSLSGCSSRSAVMVHPRSGATVKCGATGTGLLATGTESFIEECVRSYEGQGYVPVEKLTPEQRAGLERRGILPKEEVTP